MNAKEKQDLVALFLRGQGVKDLSIFFACTEQTVQRVLREAIAGLSHLNSRLGTELRARRAADAIETEAETRELVAPVEES